MSAGTDDNYGPTNQNQVQSHSGHDTEPADPGRNDHSARREKSLAPESVKPDRMPDPFVSETGEILTVAEAGETYLKVQKSNLNRDDVTSKHEYHKYDTYPQIQAADRHFQHKYDGLTTAMLTRRLSPINDAGNWLTPWECNEMLHGGNVHRSVRRALDYQLDAYEYEWIAVTAPTTSAGTPHEHIYLWIDYPTDNIGTDQLSSGLDKHLKHCNNAYEKDHRYREDGSCGALTVQHDPDRVDALSIPFYDIKEHCPTYEESGRAYRTTQGAQYIASQLAHLPLADFYNPEKEKPPQALFEGAALAWASPHNWLRTTRGVPE